jgi:hypothetical protein
MVAERGRDGLLFLHLAFRIDRAVLDLHGAAGNQQVSAEQSEGVVEHDGSS